MTSSHWLKSFTSTLLALVLSLASSAVLAEDVALLDWRKALLDTDAAQRDMDELRAGIAAQQQEAQALGGELERLSSRLANEGEDLDDAEGRALVKELQQKGQRFDQLRLEIAEARQESEQRFLDRFEAAMDQSVNEVIARHQVKVLVDPNGVLYSSDDLPDLTAEVTEILNAQ
ncbi:OmpH family outer membrane protein [Halomonas huangheensis]|uniref:Molecular chaperone Skp n=1 Tax=Halomonas huangheensis TaxID=1178482 RepID=W1N2S0_9GAMM|nr:OmpH family outer membrane protein [Halomonas huangheensis]ERL49779.1 hypothetical protein BJB45_01280 [Halomonas huangheensis]